MQVSGRITAIFGLVVASTISANFTSFIDYETTAVGLRDGKGDVCLSVVFAVTIINLNINDTDNRIPFDLTSTTIDGYCAKEAKGDALLTATARHNKRKKQMKFYFGTKNVLVKKYEELRWQLCNVVYSETYGDDTVSFESDNSSIVMSAPLAQKYVCKDRLNITLHSPGFRDVIAEFAPEIDVQPYGPKSNFYLCERTRKRTLAESFENKGTVFSGIVLGLTSVSAMIGHAMVNLCFISPDTAPMQTEKGGVMYVTTVLAPATIVVSIVQFISDVIAEFAPEIDVQPYGPKSNFYLCERTRKRTLAESFENKGTVFSGIVLGLTSMSAMIGHAVRRHFIPERKQMYDNLGGQ